MDMMLVKETNPILYTSTPLYLPTDAVDVDYVSRTMLNFMEQKNGVGLAAPQIGLSIRLFVMNINRPLVCINPKIIRFSNEKDKCVEGCLSFPNLFLNIERSAEIDVEFFDVNLHKQEMNLRQLEARCFMHELDHLEGITFTKKVSMLHLNIAKRKRLRIQSN